MARIRRLIISNFRSIQALDWVPAPGINCLIGPGDSGKSSILDAIDLCVGARRGGTFGDMDFFALNVETPITISVTLGDLPVSLMDIDVYGEFLPRNGRSRRRTASGAGDRYHLAPASWCRFGTYLDTFF